MEKSEHPGVSSFEYMVKYGYEIRQVKAHSFSVLAMLAARGVFLGAGFSVRGMLVGFVFFMRGGMSFVSVCPMCFGVDGFFDVRGGVMMLGGKNGPAAGNKATSQN